MSNNKPDFMVIGANEVIDLRSWEFKSKERKVAGTLHNYIPMLRKPKPKRRSKIIDSRLKRNCNSKIPSKASHNQKAETNKFAQESYMITKRQQINHNNPESESDLAKYRSQMYENVEKADLLQNSMAYKNVCSPFWNTSGLLEKHNDVIKLISSQRNKREATLLETENDTRTNQDVLWKKYEAKHVDSSIYRVASKDICRCSYGVNSGTWWSQFLNTVKYPSCGLYIIMGSMCGLLVMYFFVWLIRLTIYWNLWAKPASHVVHKEKINLLYCLKYIGAIVLNKLEIIGAELQTLITETVPEVVFTSSSSTEPSPWWSYIM